MPWSSPTERIIAVGKLHIYTGPNGFSFLHVGDLLHTFRPLPRCQCWCVDGVSIFAFRVLPDTYYRVELPSATPADLALVEQMKATLAQILSYERTACPFARGFPELTPEEEMRRKGRRKSHGPARRWRMDRAQSWKPEDWVEGELSGSVGSSEEDEVGTGTRGSDEEDEEADRSERVKKERSSDIESTLRVHGRAGIRSVTASTALSQLQNSMRADGSGDSRDDQVTPGRLDAARLRTFQSIPTSMPPSPPDSSSGLELGDPPSRLRRFDNVAEGSNGVEAGKSDELQVDRVEEEEEKSKDEEEVSSPRVEKHGAYARMAYAEDIKQHAAGRADENLLGAIHGGVRVQETRARGEIQADRAGQAISSWGREAARINSIQDGPETALRNSDMEAVKKGAEIQASEESIRGNRLGNDSALPRLQTLQQTSETELEAAISVKTGMRCREAHVSVYDEVPGNEAKVLHSQSNVERRQVGDVLIETIADLEESKASVRDTPPRLPSPLPVQQSSRQIIEAERDAVPISPAGTDKKSDHEAMLAEEPPTTIATDGEPNHIQPMNNILDPTTTSPVSESTFPEPDPEPSILPSSTTSSQTSRPQTPASKPAIEDDDPFAAIQARIQARRSIGGTIYPPFTSPTISSSSYSSSSSTTTTTTIASRRSASSQQQALTSELVRRACAVVLGPPAHLVAFMLRIAARIASGTWGNGGGEFWGGERGLENVPGTFDLRKVGMSDLGRSRRCLEEEEEEEEEGDEDEDDFGVPLRSPVRLATGTGMRERKVRNIG